jgi:hypothetical protein
MGVGLLADGDSGAARPVTRRWPGPATGGAASQAGEEDIMLVEHAHPPGRFDPGHCRGCARESDLLDHYWQVQRQEEAFTEAHRWSRRAHRHASWALWCSGVGILLAVVAIFTG